MHNRVILSLDNMTETRAFKIVENKKTSMGL
jgi:hypothetical protein